MEWCIAINDWYVINQIKSNDGWIDGLVVGIWVRVCGEKNVGDK